MRTPASGQELVSGGAGYRAEKNPRHTRNSVIPIVFLAHTTVAVAVEAGHGLLGEEGEGLFEDW